MDVERRIRELDEALRKLRHELLDAPPDQRGPLLAAQDRLLDQRHALHTTGHPLAPEGAAGSPGGRSQPQSRPQTG